MSICDDASNGPVSYNGGMSGISNVNILELFSFLHLSGRRELDIHLGLISL